MLGVVGEYNAKVHRALKLPTYAAGFEIGLAELLTAATNATHYVPLAKFPKVQQDISLRVPAELPFAQLYTFLQTHLEAPENCQLSWQPLDIYQSEQDAAHKQLAFRLSIASYERTLTDSEVNALLDQVAEQAKTALGAERI